MREDAFRTWLYQTDLGSRPISDAISRCKRVCNALDIDLDTEYQKDGGVSLLNLLQYTIDDVKSEKPYPQGLHFKAGSDIKNGMASLKNAVKRYFDFCKSTK